MRRLIPLAVAFALALPTVPAAAGVAAPSTASVGATAAAIAAPGRLLPAAAKPAATVAGASALQKTGKVRLAVTSNAAKVAVKYRTAKNKKRTATIQIKKGKGAKTLAKGSRSIQVQAKATKKLAKSPWVSIGGEAVVPNVGAGSYTIGPDSAVLPPMSKYSTLNQYTRHYYLIRSYLERFEAAGGGHLVLRPGRYEISSTLYVPSNVTIQLSAGTTLVKSNQTGTSKFSPSNSMFMLIRPALGKVSGAVGGHDGDRNITIVGAGGGQSVIDMADIYDTLAIIAGHNRNVTISGITFKRMNNNHFIELDACADCTISGNEFLDAAGGTRETAEAINLDTPDPNTHGFSSVWSNQDATPNERVTIEGNRFDGLQRAFGTHNFSAGRYHTDIVVRGNTLTNMRNDGIQIMNWRNAVFTGNAISAGSGHSGINTCGTKTPTITGNTFGSASQAVRFRSCSGENGTTAANEVTAEGVMALKANSVGAGLGETSVSVPDYGTVYFDGYEPPPGSPYPTLTPGDGRITVDWEQPYADPGAPVTGFLVELSTSVSGPAERAVELPAESTSTVFDGVTNGTRYYVRVVAHSRVGDSQGYWQGSVTPVALPAAPINVTVSGTAVFWDAPTNAGAGNYFTYKVYASFDQSGTSPVSASPFSAWSDYWYATGLTGVTAGQRIWVQISAVNASGEGPKAAPVAVTAG